MVVGGGGGGGIGCLCYYLHVVYKVELLISFLNLTSVSSPRLLGRTRKGLFFVVGQTRTTIETAGDHANIPELN